MDKPLGTHINGYLECSLDSKRYYLHRLAWFYVYKVWPSDNIDHINGNKSDNRLVNLRQATQSQNMHNRNKYKNNTSGYKGVTWHKQYKKWNAQITYNNKLINLGFFDCPVEAHKAYCKAADKMHKEFANEGSKCL
jgi:hypothetical protein